MCESNDNTFEPVKVSEATLEQLRKLAPEMCRTDFGKHPLPYMGDFKDEPTLKENGHPHNYIPG